MDANRKGIKLSKGVAQLVGWFPFIAEELYNLKLHYTTSKRCSLFSSVIFKSPSVDTVNWEVWKTESFNILFFGEGLLKKMCMCRCWNDLFWEQIIIFKNVARCCVYLNSLQITRVIFERNANTALVYRNVVINDIIIILIT